MEIVSVTGDSIVATGSFSDRILKEVWMPIKKKELLIPGSVTMTYPYNSKSGLTTFSFCVAINVVEKSKIPGYIIAGAKGNKHKKISYGEGYDKQMYQYLLNQATIAFVNGLLAYCNKHQPRQETSRAQASCMCALKSLMELGT
ncbi:MAG: hypothetical protein LBT19_02120 [Candidatus Nomurabacteria bacterium]|jgi:hypothetical protein|nr:hypothetical protein [Candidatus Nomurabacteria bacterium]